MQAQAQHTQAQSEPLTEQKYRDALSKFNWFFEFADDRKTWSAGASQLASLRIMQKQIDPAGVIWNEYRPNDREAPTPIVFDGAA